MNIERIKVIWIAFVLVIGMISSVAISVDSSLDDEGVDDEVEDGTSSIDRENIDGAREGRSDDISWDGTEGDGSDLDRSDRWMKENDFGPGDIDFDDLDISSRDRGSRERPERTDRSSRSERREEFRDSKRAERKERMRERREEMERKLDEIRERREEEDRKGEYTVDTNSQTTGHNLQQSEPDEYTITEDTIWDEDKWIEDNVIVEEDANLTIEPGVEVLFNGDFTLTVAGNLSAEGEDGNEIYFTSNETDPNPGDWNGIEFRPKQESNSTLDYVNVSYAGIGITIDGISLNITNSEITGNERGIVLVETAEADLIDNVISDNEVYGIFTEVDSKAEFTVSDGGYSEVYNNSIDMNGNITVESGGELSMMNGTMEFWDANVMGKMEAISGSTTEVISHNVTVDEENSILWLNETHWLIDSNVDGEYHINVTSDGHMVVQNESIITSNQNFAYEFWVQDGGTLEVYDSSIYHCGYENEFLNNQGLWINSDNASLNNATVGDGYAGIVVYQSSPFIQNSNVNESTIDGIIVHESTDLTLKRNTIRDNGRDAIYIYDSEVEIIDCEMFGNEIGVYAEGTEDDIHVKDSLIEDNDVGGIYSSEAANLDIQNNTITDNTDYGIFLDSVDQAEIWENNITENGVGIIVIDCDPYIHNNEISNNDDQGIYWEADDINANIHDNVIVENGDDGVYFNATEDLYIWNENIEGNNISANGGSGIFGVAGGYIELILNQDNNIINDNGHHGIELEAEGHTEIEMQQTILRNGENGLDVWSREYIDAEIYNSDISSNGDTGAYLYSESDVSITIEDSVIEENDYRGVYVESIVVDEYNAVEDGHPELDPDAYSNPVSSKISLDVYNSSISYNGFEGEGYGIEMISTAGTRAIGYGETESGSAESNIYMNITDDSEINYNGYEDRGSGISVDSNAYSEAIGLDSDWEDRYTNSSDATTNFNLLLEDSNVSYNGGDEGSDWGYGIEASLSPESSAETENAGNTNASAYTQTGDAHATSDIDIIRSEITNNGYDDGHGISLEGEVNSFIDYNEAWAPDGNATAEAITGDANFEINNNIEDSNISNNGYGGDGYGIVSSVDVLSEIGQNEAESYEDNATAVARTGESEVTIYNDVYNSSIIDNGEDEGYGVLNFADVESSVGFNYADASHTAYANSTSGAATAEITNEIEDSNIDNNGYAGDGLGVGSIAEVSSEIGENEAQSDEGNATAEAFTGSADAMLTNDIEESSISGNGENTGFGVYNDGSVISELGGNIAQAEDTAEAFSETEGTNFHINNEITDSTIDNNGNDGTGYGVYSGNVEAYPWIANNEAQSDEGNATAVAITGESEVTIYNDVYNSSISHNGEDDGHGVYSEGGSGSFLSNNLANAQDMATARSESGVANFEIHNEIIESHIDNNGYYGDGYGIYSNSWYVMSWIGDNVAEATDGDAIANTETYGAWSDITNTITDSNIDNNGYEGEGSGIESSVEVYSEISQNSATSQEGNATAEAFTGSVEAMLDNDVYNSSISDNGEFGVYNDADVESSVGFNYADASHTAYANSTSGAATAGITNEIEDSNIDNNGQSGLYSSLEVDSYIFDNYAWSDEGNATADAFTGSAEAMLHNDVDNSSISDNGEYGVYNDAYVESSVGFNDADANHTAYANSESGAATAEITNEIEDSSIDNNGHEGDGYGIESTAEIHSYVDSNYAESDEGNATAEARTVESEVTIYNDVYNSTISDNEEYGVYNDGWVGSWVGDNEADAQDTAYAYSETGEANFEINNHITEGSSIENNGYEGDGNGIESSVDVSSWIDQNDAISGEGNATAYAESSDIWIDINNHIIDSNIDNNGYGGDGYGVHTEIEAYTRIIDNSASSVERNATAEAFPGTSEVILNNNVYNSSISYNGLDWGYGVSNEIDGGSTVNSNTADANHTAYAHSESGVANFEINNHITESNIDNNGYGEEEEGFGIYNDIESSSGIIDNIAISDEWDAYSYAETEDALVDITNTITDSSIDNNGNYGSGYGIYLEVWAVSMIVNNHAESDTGDATAEADTGDALVDLTNEIIEGSSIDNNGYYGSGSGIYSEVWADSMIENNHAESDNGDAIAEAETVEASVDITNTITDGSSIDGNGYEGSGAGISLFVGAGSMIVNNHAESDTGDANAEALTGESNVILTNDVHSSSISDNGQNYGAGIFIQAEVISAIFSPVSNYAESTDGEAIAHAESGAATLDINNDIIGSNIDNNGYEGEGSGISLEETVVASEILSNHAYSENHLATATASAGTADLVLTNNIEDSSISGNGRGYGYEGYGVYLQTEVISVVFDNSAESNTGDATAEAYADTSDVVLTNNIIEDSSISDNGYCGDGGGIYSEVLAESLIEDNHAESYTGDATAYSETSSVLVEINNDITESNIDNNGYKGDGDSHGVYFESEVFSEVNSNSAMVFEGEGDATAISETCAASIEIDNEIIDSTLDNNGHYGDGHGLYLSSFAISEVNSNSAIIDEGEGEGEGDATAEAFAGTADVVLINNVDESSISGNGYYEDGYGIYLDTLTLSIVEDNYAESYTGQTRAISETSATSVEIYNEVTERSNIDNNGYHGDGNGMYMVSDAISNVYSNHAYSEDGYECELRTTAEALAGTADVDITNYIEDSSISGNGPEGDESGIYSDTLARSIVEYNYAGSSRGGTLADSETSSVSVETNNDIIDSYIDNNGGGLHSMTYAYSEINSNEAEPRDGGRANATALAGTADVVLTNNFDNSSISENGGIGIDVYYETYSLIGNNIAESASTLPAYAHSETSDASADLYLDIDESNIDNNGDGGVSVDGAVESMCDTIIAESQQSGSSLESINGPADSYMEVNVNGSQVNGNYGPGIGVSNHAESYTDRANSSFYEDIQTSPYTADIIANFTDSHVNNNSHGISLETNGEVEFYGTNVEANNNGYDGNEGAGIFGLAGGNLTAELEEVEASDNDVVGIGLIVEFGDLDLEATDVVANENGWNGGIFGLAGGNLTADLQGVEASYNDGAGIGLIAELGYLDLEATDVVANENGLLGIFGLADGNLTAELDDVEASHNGEVGIVFLTGDLYMLEAYDNGAASTDLIDGSGDLDLEATDVVANENDEYGIYAEADGNLTADLEDVEVLKNNFGIELISGGNMTSHMLTTSITHNEAYGLYLFADKQMTLHMEDNDIYKNGAGLYAQSGMSMDVNIMDNYFGENDGTGAYLGAGSIEEPVNGTIGGSVEERNHFVKNVGDGLSIQYGGDLSIGYNIIENNENTGLRMENSIYHVEVYEDGEIVTKTARPQIFNNVISRNGNTTLDEHTGLDDLEHHNGIYLEGSSAVITDNEIEDNWNCGVALVDSGLTEDHNIEFENNFVRENYVGIVSLNSNIEIKNSEITYNRGSTEHGEGGGIYSLDGSTVNLVNNEISYNLMYGVYTDWDSRTDWLVTDEAVAHANTIILRGDLEVDGGAIYLEDISGEAYREIYPERIGEKFIEEYQQGLLLRNSKHDRFGISVDHGVFEAYNTYIAPYDYERQSDSYTFDVNNDAYLSLENCRILRPRSINVDSSEFTISGTVFGGASHGALELYDSSGAVTTSEFGGNSNFDIYLEDSDLTLNYVYLGERYVDDRYFGERYLSDSDVAIESLDSTFTIENSEIYASNEGVRARGDTEFEMHNSMFTTPERIDYKDVHLRDEAVGHLFNVTGITPEHDLRVRHDARLEVYWNVRVEVVDVFWDPVEYEDVSVQDMEGTLIAEATTNWDGITEEIMLHSKTYHSDAIEEHSPYSFMTEEREETRIIDDYSVIELGPGRHPEFISTPPTDVMQDSEYFYNADAVDPYHHLYQEGEIDLDDLDDIELGTYRFFYWHERQNLIYSLVEKPEGMTVDPQTGEITWTPDHTQVGSHDVTLRVQNARGRYDEQTWTINVENVNDPPIITSDPIAQAHRGVEYQYNVDAIDYDDDELTYSLVQAPEGMEIDSEEGLITWTPTHNQVRNHTVIVEVCDGTETTRQEFTVSVTDPGEQTFLTDPSVSRDTGTTEDTFIFTVNYRDLNRHAPEEIYVVIDGERHEMEPALGTAYDKGVIYEYETTLDSGTLNYHFEVETEDGDIVQTEKDVVEVTAEPILSTLQILILLIIIILVIIALAYYWKRREATEEEEPEEEPELEEELEEEEPEEEPELEEELEEEMDLEEELFEEEPEEESPEPPEEEEPVPEEEPDLEEEPPEPPEEETEEN